jgi:hypothetical protein
VALAYFDYLLQAGHLCLREERKKTKGPEKDKQKWLRPPMSDGGEEEDLWFSCSPPSDIGGLSLF